MLCYVSTQISKTQKQAAFFSADFALFCIILHVFPWIVAGSPADLNSSSGRISLSVSFTGLLKHLTICGLLEEYTTYMHPLHCGTHTHMQSRSHYQAKQTVSIPCTGVVACSAGDEQEKARGRSSGLTTRAAAHHPRPPSTNTRHRTRRPQNAPAASPRHRHSKNTKTQQKRKRQIRFSQTALTME